MSSAEEDISNHIYGTVDSSPFIVSLMELTRSDSIWNKLIVLAIVLVSPVLLLLILTFASAVILFFTAIGSAVGVVFLLFMVIELIYDFIKYLGKLLSNYAGNER